MVGGDADPGPLTEAAGVRPSTSERREVMEPSDQVASQRTHWQEEYDALTLAQVDSRSSPGPRRSSRSGHREPRSEEHTSELQSQSNLVCRLLLVMKN